MDTKVVTEEITDWIRNYVQSAGADGVVIGISGGVDSAVTCRLCLKAFENEPGRIHTLHMPEGHTTNEEYDVIEEIIGVDTYFDIINIDEILYAFNASPRAISKLAQMNLKSRVRMCLLYQLANEHNLLVVGTSNKSELMLGYTTKYGDGGVDFEPIGDVYKTDVYELAKYLKVPESVIERPPSAGLYEGQTDEDELGYTYEVIDDVLKLIESGESTLIHSTAMDDIQGIIRKNEHKSRMPPICNVTR